MAQGFLAPTKTGKFGEALGNVAAAVGPAQSAEEKRNIEMAQIRAELAAAGLGQARKTESQKMLREALSPPPPTQPTGEVPSQPPGGGQPTGATSGQPAAGAPRQPTTQLSRFTDDQLMRMVLSGDPDAKALADMELKLRKDWQESQRVLGNEIIDLATGNPVYQAPEEQKPFNLPGLEDTVLLTPRQYQKIMAEINGLPPEQREAKARQLTQGLPTQTQTEQRRREATERATSNVKAENKIYDDAAAAPDLIRSADTLIQLGTSPNTKGTFGILQQSGFLGALGQLGEDALRFGGFTVGIPSIETAIRTATKSPAEIRAAELAAQASKTLALNFRKIFYQGQGAISSTEDQNVQMLGGSNKDTPETLVAKAEMIKGRAQFDKEVANIFREAQQKGVGVRDFRQHEMFKEKYEQALATYENKLQNIRDSIINFQSAEAPKASPKAAPNTVQGRTGAWERQPNGSLKAKKD